MNTSLRLFHSQSIQWNERPLRNHRRGTDGVVADYFLGSRCGRFRLEWSGAPRFPTRAMYRNGKAWVEFRETTFEEAKCACRELLVAAACLARDAERHLGLLFR